MNDEMTFGDFSHVSSEEKMAYNAMYATGSHPGSVIDFDDAVDMCTDALRKQKELIFDAFDALMLEYDNLPIRELTDSFNDWVFAKLNNTKK